MASSAAFGFGRDAPGQYILIRDEKASTVQGGTFTSGAWRTRDLNAKVVDQTGEVVLAANQFTLPAGTYRFSASAPAREIGNHTARLQNVTDASTVLVGEVLNAAPGAFTTTHSRVEGQFTIAASKTFELQHRCAVTQATFGLGESAGFASTSEVYASIELIRVTNAPLITPEVPTQYALLRDEKASATAGGTFTSGAYQTRDLNVKVTDEIGITLAANQFTLPAGTYRVRGRGQADRVGFHRMRLQNITDATTEIDGPSHSIPGGVAAPYDASVDGQIVVVGSKVFELQHRCSSTFATSGFGLANSFGPVEVYASIVIEKVA